ncbi:MAG: lipocalin-like domain-containing protein [Desulfomonilaceae bacterium]|nr:lipocalin-like domain-containing protein [Desulfomonilaceae bacterium]
MIRTWLTVLTVVVLAAAFSWAGKTDFEDARPGRTLTFPRDHGKHPEFQTEWWYFTGNLTSDRREWGFQLTFFRRGMVKEPAERKSAWAVRDLYPAHFALTDVTGKKFHHAELLSREGPGLAQADLADLNVRVKDWSARRKGDEIHVKARQDGYALELTLKPLKPVVLHGDRGYSRKGDTHRQASYYYSFTRLEASGTVTFDGTSHKVRGSAWMDHEFGSSLLREDQAGWDWFSLQLDDGSELMVFRLRKRDGSHERPFGTFVTDRGHAVDLEGRRITVTAEQTWTSPRTHATYPSKWTIEIPSKKITLTIVPLLHDQEFIAERSTGIIYWEGAVKAHGSLDGRPVSGKGYVELTGYAHALAGRL